MVAAPGRSWRVYAGPAAFLLAATIVVALVRGQFRHHPPAGNGPAPTHVTRQPVQAPAHAKPSAYVVRAGDTIVAIAAKTGVTAAQILRLNPGVSPTALFIGEKIKLR